MGIGRSQPQAFQAPEQIGVDMNSSNYGMPVPLVYGQNKTSGNCIWYGDFQVQQVQQGGKGGGGQTAYDYHSSFMLVFCEGPIASFGNAWQGSSFQTLANLNPAFLATGAIGQAPWSHFGGVEAVGYSGFSLVAWLNYDLGSQATTPNYQIEVNGLQQFGGGISDANPWAIIQDICSNAYHGIGFGFLGDGTAYSNYCVANGLFISPVYNTESTAGATLADLFSWTNTQAYFSEGVLKMVPYGDVAVTGNGATYTPNLTSAWDFTDADYVVDDASTPPLNLSRKALPDTSNTVRVEYSDRAYYYYSEMVEARDQEDAITNGVRAETSKKIDAITTPNVARFVAQNILQRSLYIRNTYSWRSSWRFSYIEPTDVVTLTDSTLGITNALVRITKITEDEQGGLEFEAEELPVGVGHSANYNTQINGGATLDVLADPGAVNTPVFFRAPGYLTPQNSPKIGVALSAASPNWGSAQIYLSYDGANYFYKTSWGLQARYGLLATGGLPSGSDPDNTNTPTVTLEQGQLIGGTQAECDALQTLCLVDQELIAYETAALQSAETYKLTYLRRGAYGTAIAAHSAGATLVRLDDSICYLPVDPSYVGQTIYVKFLSLNVFGKTPRTLAEETAYSYVVGTNANLPDQAAVPSGFAAQIAPDGVFLNWVNVNPAAVAVTSIERSPDGSTWSVIAQVGNAHTSYHDIWSTADLAVAGKTYDYRARALGSLPQARFSDYTSVINSASKPTTSTANLPNVIGTTANFNVTAAGWYEIALSDNAVYADTRCAFTCTATTQNGATQGTCEFKVTNDSTSTHFGLTQLQGAPGSPFTSLRLRNDGSNHTALDVYINWASGTISVQIAVAPITGAWNGAQAQPGSAATSGTIIEAISLDPQSTGGNAGGFGHTGPGGKWHMLTDSGDFYHGGVHFGQGGVLDQNNVSIGGRAEKLGTTVQQLNTTGQLVSTDEIAADGTGTKLFRYGTLASRPAAGTAGRIYHAEDAGTNGIIYRDTGSAWQQIGIGHLADANGTLTNVADDSIYNKSRAAGMVNGYIKKVSQDGTNLFPSKGTGDTQQLNLDSEIIEAATPTYIRLKQSQQTAIFQKPSQGHVVDPTFTSVADFWSNVGTAAAGVFTLPAMTANQGNGPGAYNTDGRGNQRQIAVKPNDTIITQITCVTAATGTVTTYFTARFVNSAGADLGVYANVAAAAAGSTTIGVATQAPANAVGMLLYISGVSGASGGNNASVSNPVVRINQETVVDVGAQKAFSDFTNNAAGGHVGKNLFMLPTADVNGNYIAPFSTSGGVDDAGLSQKAQWGGLGNVPNTIAGHNLTGVVQPSLPATSGKKHIWASDSGGAPYETQIFDTSFGHSMATFQSGATASLSATGTATQVGSTVVIPNPHQAVNFSASAFIQVNQNAATTAFQVTGFVRYSVNGGSTWTNGINGYANFPTTAADIRSLACGSTNDYKGTPSGDIWVQFMYQTAAGAGTFQFTNGTMTIDVAPLSPAILRGGTLADTLPTTGTASGSATYPATTASAGATLIGGSTGGLTPVTYSNARTGNGGGTSDGGSITSGATASIFTMATATLAVGTYTGVYSQTATDSTTPTAQTSTVNCTVTSTISQAYAAISPSIQVTSASCSTGTSSGTCTATGNFTVTASGGNGSYTYSNSVYSYDSGFSTNPSITSGATTSTGHYAGAATTTATPGTALNVTLQTSVNDTRSTGAQTAQGIGKLTFKYTV